MFVESFRFVAFCCHLPFKNFNSVASFCSFIQAIAAHEDVDLVRSLRFPFCGMYPSDSSRDLSRFLVGGQQ